MEEVGEEAGKFVGEDVGVACRSVGGMLVRVHFHTKRDILHCSSTQLLPRQTTKTWGTSAYQISTARFEMTLRTKMAHSSISTAPKHMRSSGAPVSKGASRDLNSNAANALSPTRTVLSRIITISKAVFTASYDKSLGRIEMYGQSQIHY